jgi:hypothetical protein
MSQPQDLPPYIRRATFEEQATFFDVFFTILPLWFNSSGFYLPTLTNADVSSFTAPYFVKIWYNSDTTALQWLDPTGTVHTITST